LSFSFYFSGHANDCCRQGARKEDAAIILPTQALGDATYNQPNTMRCTHLVAELAPNENDLEDRVAARLQQRMDQVLVGERFGRRTQQKISSRSSRSPTQAANSWRVSKTL
jgi:hypothetical protein